MNSLLDRRHFIKNCSLCCSFFLCYPKTFAFQENQQPVEHEKKAADPEKLTYCGFKCDDNCELLKATKDNNIELKKKVYENWEWKKTYGIEFDADKVFCYGCKIEDKPYNLIIQKCTVRKCTIDRKLSSCIQCKKLKGCDKELWSRFPDFKKQIEKLQEDYVALTKKELL
jgi:hypothetical protein